MKKWANRWLVGLALLVLASLAARAEFAAVVPGQAVSLPRDLGAHPEFRTEWWYVTGWVSDSDAVSRGFQVTFFRVATGLAVDNPSRFAPQQLVMAHAAVADPGQGRLLHGERASRADGPLAGADTAMTRAWVRDWRLEGDGKTYSASVVDAEFAFDLRLAATQAPLLNGAAGYSRKGPEPASASFYYSQPQLAVEGRLRIGEREFSVQGRAWLDHEWSSAYLPKGARGWDWIGINLTDGGALMAFRMRDGDGQALWAGASLRAPDGSAQTFGPAEVRFQPGPSWTSPRSGATYPVGWTVELGNGPAKRRFTVEPMMTDQELDSRASTDTIYWEGAVRVREAGVERGHGYLEMTGYAGELAM